jgi:hypothetical protein
MQFLWPNESVRTKTGLGGLGVFSISGKKISIGPDNRAWIVQNHVVRLGLMPFALLVLKLGSRFVFVSA